MNFIFLIIAGFTGGVLGGMGMGGGTILIPILTILFNLGQHSSQAINLISFIPMAVVAIIIHFKKKLISFKNILYIIIPGLATCTIGCFLAKAIEGALLKRFFGGFLIVLSIVQFIFGLMKTKNS